MSRLLQQWANDMGYGIEQSPDSIGIGFLSNDTAHDLCKQQLNSLWSFLIRRVHPKLQVQHIRRRLERFKRHIENEPFSLNQHLNPSANISEKHKELEKQIKAAKSRNETLRSCIHREEMDQADLRRAMDGIGFEIALQSEKLNDRQKRVLLADAHARKLLENSASLLRDAEYLAQLTNRNTVPHIENEQNIVTDIITIMRDAVNDKGLDLARDPTTGIKDRSQYVDPGRVVLSISKDVDQDLSFVNDLSIPVDTAMDSLITRLISQLAKQHSQRFVETKELEVKIKMLERDVDIISTRLAEQVKHTCNDSTDAFIEHTMHTANLLATRKVLSKAMLYKTQFEDSLQDTPNTNSDPSSLAFDNYQFAQNEMSKHQAMLDALISTTHGLHTLNVDTLNQITTDFHAMSVPETTCRIRRVPKAIKQSGIQMFDQVKTVSINRALVSLNNDDAKKKEWNWISNELMTQIRKASSCRLYKSYQSVLDEMQLCKFQVSIFESLIDRTVKLNETAKSCHETNKNIIVDCDDFQLTTKDQYTNHILPMMNQSLQQAEQSHRTFNLIDGIVKERNWFMHERKDPFAPNGSLENYINQRCVPSPDIG
ncbi:hypothetical protein BDV3_006529 [Batrachochytrium dendrobatidis]